MITFIHSSTTYHVIGDTKTILLEMWLFFNLVSYPFHVFEDFNPIIQKHAKWLGRDNTKTTQLEMQGIDTFTSCMQGQHVKQVGV